MAAKVEEISTQLKGQTDELPSLAAALRQSATSIAAAAAGVQKASSQLAHLHELPLLRRKLDMMLGAPSFRFLLFPHAKAIQEMGDETEPA